MLCTVIGWFGMSGCLGGVITKCVHHVERDDVAPGSTVLWGLRELMYFSS